MGFLHGAHRPEELQFLERLDDSSVEDKPVRFLDAFVGALALAVGGFRRAIPAATGRPGYAPGDLLKLYLYGYLNRLRSRRRLEREPHRNIALMWLLQKLRPAHKTIADCRKNNLKPLRQVCRTCILLCKKRELFGAELVAIDGRKVRAVNATERTVTRERLTKRLAQIDERITAHRRARAHRDAQEDPGTVGGAHPAALAATIAALHQRQRL